MRRPKSVALTTISLANSIPVVLRPMRSIASFRKPRMPQWKSEIGTRKKRRPRKERTGLPSQRWSSGMAPGSIRPRKREPMTRSFPSSSLATKAGTSPKS